MINDLDIVITHLNQVVASCPWTGQNIHQMIKAFILEN